MWMKDYVLLQRNLAEVELFKANPLCHSDHRRNLKALYYACSLGSLLRSR